MTSFDHNTNDLKGAEMKQMKVIVHRLNDILELPQVKKRLAEIEAATQVDLAVPPVMWTDEVAWSDEDEANYRSRHRD